MIDPKVFKQVRKALGLSQQELADAIGLSRVTINKMERGKLARGIPDEIAARLMGLKSKPAPDGIDYDYVSPSEREAVNVNDDLWDNEEEDES